jgi:hypothetical protein
MAFLRMLTTHLSFARLALVRLALYLGDIYKVKALFISRASLFEVPKLNTVKNKIIKGKVDIHGGDKSQNRGSCWSVVSQT